MPRVSVIIPAFNAEDHLRETLESIKAQTFDDWEVVVGDDASHDQTAEIAEQFDPRVVVVRSSENLGPAATRNLAIGHSSGELLAFLDADDYWLPEYLARQVGAFDAAGGVRARIGIVASNARLLRSEGFLSETYMDLVHYPDEMTVARLLHSNPIFVSAMSPRAVVDEVGGFCPEIFGTEDHDLWVRIVERGYRVIANRDPLAVYRIQPGSVSANQGSMARASQAVYRRALTRGNLTPAERRVARRELRRQRAIEQIATADGLSYRRALRVLPLLLVVAAEHPRGWRTMLRMLRRGPSGLSSFPS
jgi:glycosyltransferase involved in cell wall biosynthesis